jgi:hypothetical protein
VSPEEYGRHLASLAPPITKDMAYSAARILLDAERETSGRAA